MPTSLLRRTVSGLFMVGIPGPGLDPATRRILSERPPGGVILFRRNVRSAEQLRALVDELHALGAGVPPLVALDHEGGRVHRLPAPFTHFPPAAAVAAGGDVRLVESVGLAMGRELAAVGIDVDFAPVLDVWSNPRNQVIGDRAFGTTPAVVARFGLALARGLARAGVVPCGKHFPGHGGTVGDSHLVLPRVRTSRRALARVDIAPFVRAIRARIPALMTAHVVYTTLDPRRPATLSSRICHDLLRRRLGFRGVLFSDDLEMQAVAGRGTPERSAVGALAAGCDMLLVCQSLDAAVGAMDGVERAVERARLDATALTRSLLRIQGLRRRRRSRRRARLGWPAHARLAARIAADVSSRAGRPAP
jgi:beta-N-acetylhexosaminidase